MKCRVVGWTTYDSRDFSYVDNYVTDAEKYAIIDEIRKHKYLFSGWHHQEHENCVPVLSDGKERIFSSRYWGGIMAEAYGKTGEWDYALFSFHSDIAEESLCIPQDGLDPYTFTAEGYEVEDFAVTVDGKTFESAKTKNPIYLDNLPELRNICDNDSLTLRCGDEELRFIVDVVHRPMINDPDNKDRKKTVLEIYHKTESEREFPTAPLVCSLPVASVKFEQAVDEYDSECDYAVVKNCVEFFHIREIADYSDCEKEDIIKMLVPFTREYASKKFDVKVISQLLDYIDDADFYAEIADVVREPYIYEKFINEYADESSEDEYALKLAEIVLEKKMSAPTYYLNVFLRAIELQPNRIEFRDYLYKYFTAWGFLALAAVGAFDRMNKYDAAIIDVENHVSTLSASEVRSIVEYMTYPSDYVMSDKYPYYKPCFYENSKVLVDGVKAYQKYVREHCNIDECFESVLMRGIDVTCAKIGEEIDGVEHAAAYVYSLDAMTDFKYDLRAKALERYGAHNGFKKALDERYC